MIPMKNSMNIFINEGECVGIRCGFCVPVCTNNAIHVDLIAHINSEACIGCMKCTKNICPNYAIRAEDGGDQF